MYFAFTLGFLSGAACLGLGVLALCAYALSKGEVVDNSSCRLPDSDQFPVPFSGDISEWQGLNHPRRNS